MNAEASIQWAGRGLTLLQRRLRNNGGVFYTADVYCGSCPSVTLQFEVHPSPATMGPAPGAVARISVFGEEQNEVLAEGRGSTIEEAMAACDKAAQAFASALAGSAGGGHPLTVTHAVREVLSVVHGGVEYRCEATLVGRSPWCSKEGWVIHDETAMALLREKSCNFEDREALRARLFPE